MAVKAILERFDNIVKLNLNVVKVVPGFNKRQDLDLNDMVPQIAARGYVVQPAEVYKEGPDFCLITAHRRFAALCLIRDIQGGLVTEEQAKTEHGLSATTYKNAKAADVEFSLPAIIKPKGNPYQLRLDSILSNAGKKLDPIEQAYEWLELMDMTLEDVAEITGRPLEKICNGRTPGSKVLQKDVAELAGVTEAHVSQLLKRVRPANDAIAEAIRVLVEQASRDKLIVSNDANTILNNAKTVKEAQDCIDAIVEEKRLSKLLKSAKGKVKTHLVELVQTGQVTPDEAAVIAEQAKTVDAVDDMVAELTETDEMTEPTPLPETQTVTDNVKKREQQLAAQKHADLMYMVGIFDRQGLVVVRDAAVRWANGKKPKQVVPWTNTADTQSDKAA